MKRIFFLAVIIFCSQFVLAQKQDTIPGSKEPLIHKKHEHDPQDAYLTFQAGEVMIIKDNKAVKLEKDIVLKDGTMVMTDGKVKKADGDIFQMKVGDRIYIDEGLTL